MCLTLQTLLESVICALQMVTRIFMTVLLMIENLVRMLMQSMYNFVSTMLQVISLLPICCVFLLTAKFKCLFCRGGGGGCAGVGGPPGPGGLTGCILSILTLAVFLFVSSQIQFMDKVFLRLGYIHVDSTSTINPRLTRTKWTIIKDSKRTPRTTTPSSTKSTHLKFGNVIKVTGRRHFRNRKLIPNTKKHRHGSVVPPRPVTGVKLMNMAKRSQLYADIDADQNTIQTTAERRVDLRPATKHRKGGNWSTLLYYLL